MIQSAGSAGLLFEATEPIRIRGMHRRQQLDRNVPVQPRVVRPVHLAHSTSTYQCRDFIGPNPRSGFQSHGFRCSLRFEIRRS